LRSEIAQENLDRGWKEGYYANYKQEKGTSVIEIVMSRYPENVLPQLLNESKAECKGTEVGEDIIYGSYSVEWELLTPPFQDSVMCKATGETAEGTTLRFFHFEFIKKDIYVYMRGEDQELIKELANIMRERIN
jgi:hypothetical protein